MPWINVKPTNSGGGRQPSAATAKLYESGQLTLSHATTAMLGDPAKVLVSYEPQLKRIRLMPTTPADNGGFVLSGGGNSPHRLGLKTIVNHSPAMVGDFIAVKIAGGLELRKAKDDE